MPDAHDRLALTEIAESAGRVAEYISGFDREAFIADRRTCDAVTMQIFVLGEAAGRLTDSARGLLGELDWRQVRGLRNRIAHGYGTVDFAIIWAIAVNDAPAFAEKARVALASETPNP